MGKEHERLRIEYRAIDDLKPYENNPRTHSDEQVDQIVASIRQFGFNNPILLDGDNGIIAGHGRLMAAQRMGLEQVPCVDLKHLTDAQKRAYVIADNQLALQSGWDLETLKAELDRLISEDFDVSAIGFSEHEMAAILDKTWHHEDADFDSVDADETGRLGVIRLKFPIARHDDVLEVITLALRAAEMHDVDVQA